MKHTVLTAAAAFTFALSAHAQTPVKIGFMGVLSGPQAALGQDMLDAFMLVVEQNGGKLGGEENALALLKKLGLDQLIFIVLRPTPGTEYAHVNPPDLEQVARLFCTARLSLPHTPLTLGCMRPGGTYRQTLDKLALACGLNGIVQPAPDAVHMAADLELQVQATSECCAF